MIRLAIIDQDGKVVAPQDVATVAELLALGEQARAFIRDSERLVREKVPKSKTAPKRHVPYSS